MAQPREPGPAAASESFWRDGYRVAEALLTPGQCELVRRSMDLSRQTGRMRTADNSAYRGPNNEYAPALGQLLLGSLVPRLAQLTGRELLASYAFWRIYEHGAVLHPHRDRNACEISVTIVIAAEPGEPEWPISIVDLHGRVRDVVLTAGSGLLYLGTRVQHWREPFPGDRHFQLFLHYVTRDGPLSAHAGDEMTIRLG